MIPNSYSGRRSIQRAGEHITVAGDPYSAQASTLQWQAIHTARRRAHYSGRRSILRAGEHIIVAGDPYCAQASTLQWQAIHTARRRAH